MTNGTPDRYCNRGNPARTPNSATFRFSAYNFFKRGHREKPKNFFVLNAHNLTLTRNDSGMAVVAEFRLNSRTGGNRKSKTNGVSNRNGQTFEPAELQYVLTTTAGAKIPVPTNVALAFDCETNEQRSSPLGTVSGVQPDDIASVCWAITKNYRLPRCGSKNEPAPG